MLEVRDLHVYYGKIHALKGVSFQVTEGEIVTLLGNNGAGKTTTLKTLSGLLAPRQGDVLLDGGSLVGAPPHGVVQKGITHVPEGRRIFNRLSVVENLTMGAYTRSDRDIASDMESVFTIFPRLKERRTQVAGTLSGGEQQMLAIGRALMAKPRLLLLDEPSMGLAPVLVEQIFETVLAINRRGVTCSWWSRMPRWRCPSRAVATCWRPDALRSREPPPNWRRTRRSGARIWARRDVPYQQRRHPVIEQG